MELYIDNKPVDTDNGSEVAISLSVASVTDPRHARSGYTRSIRLPMTPANDAVFGFAFDVNARDRFNASRHTGRVEHEGVALIEGPLCLKRCQTHSDGGGFYEVYIVGAAKEWASRAASRRLGATDLYFSRTLGGAAIQAGWTDSSPVKFLPVAREQPVPDYSRGHVIPAMKILTADDYHPFINAAALMHAIFAESGYRIESRFMDGSFFRSLYISGNYHTRDVSTLKADMDFLARRVTQVTAAADYNGRVYADPSIPGISSVGNIVETADPKQTGGLASHADVFTLNGCFTAENNRVVFIPTSEVAVGFQYRLAYTTDYRMKNRKEMAGFCEIDPGDGTIRKFTVANPYPDRRTNLRPMHVYTLAIFEFVAGRQYQFRYTRRTEAGAGTIISSEVLTTRFATVTTNTTLNVVNPALRWRASATSAWQDYTGEWALYDGMIGETGQLDIELTVRTAPERITPGNPKFFDMMSVGGAEPGMRMTLKNSTYVRPVFHAQPTEGTTVAFADVCVHDASQMDFINSLRQMFNLTFQTDNRERVVKIEPARDFWASGGTVDWTNRIDLSKPVETEELGGELSRRMVWSYRSGDGAVARFNRSNGGRFGEWSTEVENSAAADGASLWENPMFTPSISDDELYEGARSARLVQAGENSAETTLSRTENLNFSPKIVRFEGMKPLPAGEKWGWPSATGSSYPKLAFHAPESGYTLCFEDRDGYAGLHSWFDNEVTLWNEGRRVTLWMALDETDVSALAFPVEGGVDFRGAFRLTIDGESCLYRLEEVVDYRPGAPSTKCVFIKAAQA
jgi:hypothetical protein